MPLPNPEPGLVVAYAYLWQSEHEQGHEEGIKDRPCAIVLIVTDDEGDKVVAVLPITHSPPKAPVEAIELPPVTKRRLGLDSDRSWVVVNEANRFVWPGPDLRPISRAEPDRFDYGVLPPDLFRQIRERFLACARAERLRTVRRTE